MDFYASNWFYNIGWLVLEIGIGGIIPALILITKVRPVQQETAGHRHRSWPASASAPTAG
jgi:hypothetical protein